MIKCKECKTEISNKAQKCPQCGAPQERHGILKIGALVVLSLIMFGMCAAMGNDDSNDVSSNPIERVMDAETNRQMTKIHNQVADDAVTQYEMVKKAGDKIQTCVHAGMVEASYIQAKDEPNFQKWNAIKKTDCAAAGMPE